MWLGSLLVFGAVCSETAYPLLGKRLTADLSPLAIAVLAAVLAAALFLPFAALQSVGFDWSAPGWTDWARWRGGVPGPWAWGRFLWLLGKVRVAGTTASGLMAVMPVSVPLLSYLLLGERFRWIHAAGIAAVLVGIALVTRGDA